MKRTATLISLIAFTLFNSCSTNQSEQSASDELPIVDANTDVVPQEAFDDSATDSFTLVDPTAPADPTTSIAPKVDEIPNSQVSTVTVVDKEATVNETVQENIVSEAPLSLDSSNQKPAPSAEITAEVDLNVKEQIKVAPSPVEEPIAKTELVNSGDQTVTVKKGDTLMKIAFKHYGNIYEWKKIYQDNKDRITNPTSLVPGTTLVIKDAIINEAYYAGYSKVLIKGGDTLGTISKDVYGTAKKWRTLWKQNEPLIHNPNRIYAGFFLRYGKEGEFKPHPLASEVEESKRNPSSKKSAKAAPSDSEQNSEIPEDLKY